MPDFVEKQDQAFSCFSRRLSLHPKNEQTSDRKRTDIPIRRNGHLIKNEQTFSTEVQIIEHQKITNKPIR